MAQAQATITYRNFIDSLKADATKRSYDLGLRQFMERYKFKSYEAMLKTDATKMEDLVKKYIEDLKREGVPPQSIRVKIAPLKHFYVMNRRALNWDWVFKFIGSPEKVHQDRLYEKAEIRRILDKCDERKRVCFLLLVSTGMRIGALPGLKLRDLTKVRLDDGNEIYRIRVYAGTPQQYATYCTPECAQAITSYMKYRQTRGETLVPEAPLIRRQFDKADANDRSHVTTDTLCNNLTVPLVDSGVRSAGVDYKKRHPAMRFHAFRKGFVTTLNAAGVKPVIRELLVGHDVGLDKSYLRPQEGEVIAEYAKAIEALTISDENRLRHKVSVLEEREKQIESRIKEQVEKEVQAIMSKIDFTKLPSQVGQ